MNTHTGTYGHTCRVPTRVSSTLFIFFVPRKFFSCHTSPCHTSPCVIDVCTWVGRMWGPETFLSLLRSHKACNIVLAIERVEGPYPLPPARGTGSRAVICEAHLHTAQHCCILSGAHTLAITKCTKVVSGEQERFPLTWKTFWRSFLSTVNPQQWSYASVSNTSPWSLPSVTLNDCS